MNSVEFFLTVSQEKNVVKAIQDAEKNTSGEIRVHIEKQSEKPTLARAKEVFLYLNMEQTKERNAVLLYIGVENKKFAILGDEGINKVVPTNFWDEEKNLVTQLLSENKKEEALLKAIEKIGEKLRDFFPYKSDDTNELPDAISKE